MAMPVTIAWKPCLNCRPLYRNIRGDVALFQSVVFKKDSGSNQFHCALQGRDARKEHYETRPIIAGPDSERP